MMIISMCIFFSSCGMDFCVPYPYNMRVNRWWCVFSTRFCQLNHNQNPIWGSKKEKLWIRIVLLCGRCIDALSEAWQRWHFHLSYARPPDNWNQIQTIHSNSYGILRCFRDGDMNKVNHHHPLISSSLWMKCLPWMFINCTFPRLVKMKISGFGSRCFAVHVKRYVGSRFTQIIALRVD